MVPHDYLAVCLEDAEQQGYLVHSLSGLAGEAVAGRVFGKDEGLPGGPSAPAAPTWWRSSTRSRTRAPDLDGVLVRAGLRVALTVPVRRGPQVLGALLFARRAAPYTFDDLEIGTLVAAGLSGGLETCRAYQALADERGTLAAVLTSTADAVVMVGQDGLVLLANPAVRAMLGVAPETMTGRPFAEAIAHEPLRRLLEAGRPGIAELLAARRAHRPGQPRRRDHRVRRAGRPGRDPPGHHAAQGARADEDRFRQHRVARPEESDHGDRHDRGAPHEGAARAGRRAGLPRSLRAHPAQREEHDRARDRPPGPRQDRGRPRGRGRAGRPGAPDRGRGEGARHRRRRPSASRSRSRRRPRRRSGACARACSRC